MDTVSILKNFNMYRYKSKFDYVMTAINIFEFQTYSSAQKDLLFFYCVEMRTFVLCRALFRD